MFAYMLGSLEIDAGITTEWHLMGCVECRANLARELRYIAAMRRALQE